jgi:hypothetical protein
MTALTPTVYHVEPAMGYCLYQVSYTKGAQNDTLDVSTYTPIKTILFVLATDDTAGAIDETTWSGTTITLTGAETGSGSMIVVGAS